MSSEQSNYRSKRIRRKLKEYLKDGRYKKLLKLKSRYVKTNYEDFYKQLNKKDKRNGKTLLCKYCALGDGDAVEMLMKVGASIEIPDKDSSNALHHALNYVLSNCAWDFFINIVSEMILKVNPEVLTAKNKYKEIPNELVEEVLANIFKRQSQYMAEEESDQRRFDERNWTEKVFYELQEENYLYNEAYAEEEFLDTYKNKESYSDWGDRMRQEYNEKHFPRRKIPSKTSYENVDQHPDSTINQTKPKTNKALIRKLKILKARENYEEKCCITFSKNNSHPLGFKDIPWPLLEENISADFSEGILDHVIEFLTLGFNQEERTLYLKQQRIRWHPDRFQQKCSNRLDENCKKQVLECVLKISQKINTTLQDKN